MRLLLIAGTRLGDAVLASGLLAHLADAEPALAATFVCGPQPAPLFVGQPGVAEVVAMAKRRRGGHWIDLWRRAAGRRWDLAIDLRGSLLTWALRADRRVVQRGRPPAALHRVEALGRLLGLDPPPAPRIVVDPALAARWAPPPGRLRLALGPTANWHAKQWPPERFAAVARALTAPGGALAGAEVVALGAAHERPSVAALLDGPDAPRDLLGGPSLPEVAAILATSRLFIGNDSGLAHLAAAVDCPTLALFGPTEDRWYRPWGPRAAVARTLETPDALYGAPGFDHRTCPNLMQSLTAAAAQTAAEALLARTGAAAPD